MDSVDVIELCRFWANYGETVSQFCISDFYSLWTFDRGGIVGSKISFMVDKRKRNHQEKSPGKEQSQKRTG
jgi:hypothetical protein